MLLWALLEQTHQGLSGDSALDQEAGICYMIIVIFFILLKADDTGCIGSSHELSSYFKESFLKSQESWRYALHKFVLPPALLHLSPSQLLSNSLPKLSVQLTLDAISLLPSLRAETAFTNIDSCMHALWEPYRDAPLLHGGLHVSRSISWVRQVSMDNPCKTYEIFGSCKASKLCLNMCHARRIL